MSIIEFLNIYYDEQVERALNKEGVIIVSDYRVDMKFKALLIVENSYIILLNKLLSKSQQDYTLLYYYCLFMVKYRKILDEGISPEALLVQWIFYRYNIDHSELLSCL